MKKFESIVRMKKKKKIRSGLKKNGPGLFHRREASRIVNEVVHGYKSYQGRDFDTQYIRGNFISILLRDLNVGSTMKKTAVIFIFCFVISNIFSYSTPTTQLWIPSTDIQGFAKLHLGFDNYLRMKNNSGTRGGTIFCAGLTAGILPFKKFQGEIGVDYFTMSDPVYDNHPLLFNFKLGIPEESLFKFSPALAFGVYNIGTKKNLTDYNIVYGLIAKTIPLFGRISAGYYYGNKTVLLDENLELANQGILLSWDRAMTEISDKLWMAVDYQSGKNAFGSLNLGLSWAFSENVSLIFGYDIWNNKNVFYNSKDTNVNSFTVQVDINF
jgi:hypothetical protein